MAASFDTYQSNAAEAPFMRKWILRALVLSLAFHAFLFFWFWSTKLTRFTPPTARLIPPTFHVTRVSIDEKAMQGEDSAPPPKAAQPLKDKVVVDIPADRPQFDKIMKEIRTTPEVLDPAKPIVNEKPRVDSSTLQTIAKLQQNASNTMQHEMDSFRDQLINDKPAVTSGPVIKFPDSSSQKLPVGNSDAAALSAATDRLGSILGNGLDGNNAAVQLPGGALFAFDKSDISPAADSALGLVAKIIAKNPGYTLVIEGYTDSFGSPEHNLDLSTRRAEAVKAWLLQKLAANNIDPSRIQSKGFGSSHYRIEPRQPADNSLPAIEAEIARQQPNRRVEIVFRIPSER